jgi:FG-GAP-like repeat
MKVARFLALFLSQLLTVTAAFAATVKFANPVFYNSGGQGTNFVVAADLNGDTFPDMIVANTNGVSILLNNTDGTFAPAVTYGSGGTNGFAVAVGDVSGDGVPDIAVTNM